MLEKKSLIGHVAVGNEDRHADVDLGHPGRRCGFAEFYVHRPDELDLISNDLDNSLDELDVYDERG